MTLHLNTISETLLTILLGFLVALLFVLLSRRISRHLIRMTYLAPRHRRIAASRQATLQGLFSGFISVGALVLAMMFCVAQFIDLSTLVWMVGLFSAAFGLGLRPLISDFLTGVSFIFEDTLGVGEKVEILDVHGVVENVGFRVVQLRGMSGELYVIPNGEIRVIRNFSRGSFSPANVTIHLETKDLLLAIELLEDLGRVAVSQLPNLIAPWQVISQDGAIGQTVYLTLIAHARFGKAAEMRPRMLALIQDHLQQAGIEFAPDA